MKLTRKNVALALGAPCAVVALSVLVVLGFSWLPEDFRGPAMLLIPVMVMVGIGAVELWGDK